MQGKRISDLGHGAWELTGGQVLGKWQRCRRIAKVELMECDLYMSNHQSEEGWGLAMAGVDVDSRDKTLACLGRETSQAARLAAWRKGVWWGLLGPPLHRTVGVFFFSWQGDHAAFRAGFISFTLAPGEDPTTVIMKKTCYCETGLVDFLFYLFRRDASLAEHEHRWNRWDRLGQVEWASARTRGQCMARMGKDLRCAGWER